MSAAANLLRSSQDNDARFNEWAAHYDSNANPLLSLEHRWLSQMLPDVSGLDVIDLGCGTGRWLKHLQQLSPRSLTGIDRSEEMLARVPRSMDVTLIKADCASLPLAEAFADVVVASFVISYVQDLHVFSRELARVLRPGGLAFISDVDAQTFRELGWQRSFKGAGATVQLSTIAADRNEILASFSAVGLQCSCLLHPPFGDSEKSALALQGKQREIHRAGSRPPIFVARFVKEQRLTPRTHLWGAQLCLHNEEKIPGTLSIPSENSSAAQLDLPNYLLLPGLINAHDHLEFALFPKLGGFKYNNCGEWATDIHTRHAEVIAKHRRVPRRTRLWWGAIRNLLAGVTTVCHHNPYEPEFLSSDFPIRVVREFQWAHSLATDLDAVAKHSATPQDQPFIIHGAEGTDEQSRKEIRMLDEAGMLDERTVLVHGLALDSESISKLNAANCSIIWCCSSNSFLYGRHHTADLMRSVKRLAIGTDSSLTAVGDLLDELRFIARHTSLSGHELWPLVTNRSAEVLRLHSGTPSLLRHDTPDIVAIRDGGVSPADTLISSAFTAVELVVSKGRVFLASPTVFECLPPQLQENMECLEIDGTLRWIRAPINSLLAEAEQYLGSDIRLGGRRLRRVSIC
jgi:cytosine/adenosine deaminase-related metal-dependent hydrolase/SAM-dependent methyltransferase